MDVIGERPRTKAFIGICKRKILHGMIFVRLLHIIVSSGSPVFHLLSLMLHLSMSIKNLNMTEFLYRLYEVPFWKSAMEKI